MEPEVQTEQVEQKPKATVRHAKRRIKPSEIISSKKLILEDSNTFRIQFPIDDAEAYVSEMIAMGAEPAHPDTIEYNPQRLDIPDEQKQWLRVFRLRQSEENLQAIAKFGKHHRFDFDSDILIRAQASSSEGRQLEKMSFAKSSTTIVLPKFGNGKQYGKLKARPFQTAGIAYAMQAEKTFIADEMGLGKTIQGLGVIAYDKMKNKLKPFDNQWLIAVPSSLRLNWIRELQKWLPKRAGHSIAMLQNSQMQLTPKGNLTKETKDFLSSHNVFVTTYDKIKRYRPVLEKLKLRGIIFDESHYLKARGSKRSILWKDYVSTMDPKFILLLSGTPLMNWPTDLINQLQILGRLHEFGGFNHFMVRYCSMRTTDLSHVATVNKAAETAALSDTAIELSDEASLRDIMVRKLYQNMTDLNKTLRSRCYVRREKSEVLADLPDKTRQMIPLEITNRKTYEKIEGDTIGFLMDRASADEKFLQSIKDMPPEQQKAKITEHRAKTAYISARAEALRRLELLKQTAAIGKLKAAKEWIDNYLETGKKLVVFAVHNAVLNELVDMYPKAVTVRGSDSPEKRQAAVDKFQNDKKCKLIIGGLKPMGVGHTLVASSTTVFLELGWTPAIHDQAEDRVHRMGQKAAVNAFYLLASKTVEEKIGALIEKKRRAVNAVGTGDPLKDGDQGSVLGDLMSTLTGKNGVF